MTPYTVMNSSLHGEITIAVVLTFKLLQIKAE